MFAWFGTIKTSYSTDRKGKTRSSNITQNCLCKIGGHPILCRYIQYADIGPRADTTIVVTAPPTQTNFYCCHGIESIVIWLEKLCNFFFHRAYVLTDIFVLCSQPIQMCALTYIMNEPFRNVRQASALCERDRDRLVSCECFTIVCSI